MEIKEAKTSQRVKDVCFDNTRELSKFMREVFSYHFKDTPRYDYLRSLLHNLIEEKSSQKSAKQIMVDFNKQKESL